MFLEKINGPADVKVLAIEEKKILAQEIRNALLKRLSIHGGHFGPNLGFVEATIALHFVFDSPKDKIVFDVSHQCYTHKMLTGRKDAFLEEDKYDDVCGFTDPLESEHDFFKVGHTSTSISLACGLAKGRDISGGTENIIAVIGDGSLSGGEALEGLNFAGEMKSNLIIVVNDNDMSIAENHGGLYKNLKELRESDGKCKNNLFTSFGLEYSYVKDGNDIESLIEAFQKTKDSKHPVVVHIVTQKGKGYSYAEIHKEEWHYRQPFHLENGELKNKFSGERYDVMTADFLLDKMAADSAIVGITAGTPTVFGFDKARREKAGKQFIDVGIAEETAVAIASGIAQNGGKPVFGVNSTFIQRTYDQISQDVCINNNPVTFLVFAASIWGMTDVTHLGLYDIAMLSNIPNLVYLAPTCKEEYFAMVNWAIEQREYPVGIRVPVNGVITGNSKISKDYSELNHFLVTQKGSRVAVLALGDFYQIGERIADQLGATLINPKYITGVDEDLLNELTNDHSVIVTLEDGILSGGFGEKIARFYGNRNIKVLNYGFKKEFIDRYQADVVMKECRITPECVCEDVEAALR